MAMNSGKRDRLVQFLRAPLIDDGRGQRRGDFEPIGLPVPASKKPISDGEKFRADTTMRDMTDRFEIPASPFTAGITATDRLTCEGVTYGIAGIKEIGRREGYEITARFLPNPAQR